MIAESWQTKNMLLSIPEVEVEHQKISNQHFLIFEFRNHFSAEAAREASEVWTRFHLDENVSAIHVWNCSWMTGFDIAAKNIWMKKMKEHDQMIDRIVLISEMIIIRGAARLISKFTKHRLDVYRSIPEMNNKEGLEI